MKYSILLVTVLLAFGCSSKKAHQDDDEIITRIGVISAKEDASLNDVEKDSGTRTSVYGSVSSGGGTSIGNTFSLKNRSLRNSPASTAVRKLRLVAAMTRTSV